MSSAISFVAKVFLLSAALAVGIKFVAPRLAVPMTPAIALVMVLLPTILMAALLMGRLWRNPFTVQRQK
ncbi:MAG: hypothetical protein VKK04_21380 [Synechococcales bacterium]|nr:hypothetical protein [Synechococcales bacterium]